MESNRLPSRRCSLRVFLSLRLPRLLTPCGGAIDVQLCMSCQAQCAACLSPLVDTVLVRQMLIYTQRFQLSRAILMLETLESLNVTYGPLNHLPAARNKAFAIGIRKLGTLVLAW